MTFLTRPFLFFLIGLTVTSQVAANTLGATTNQQIQKTPLVTKIWSGFLDVSRSTSLADQADGTRHDGLEYTTRLGAQINADFSLNAQGGYSQNLKYPEEDDFSDTTLNLLRAPFPLGKSFLLGYRLGLELPTSKDSQVRQSLLGSLSAGLRLGLNPQLLFPGFTVNGDLSVRQNFHQYETALDGKINTKYSSVQSLSLGYQFPKGIFLSTDFFHRATWSYQDIQRNSFEMSQELGYTLNPHWGIALGHTNSGSTLKPNGTDSNIQVIDDNESLVYASTNFRF